jgi:dUTP pyrophosphatase
MEIKLKKLHPSAAIPKYAKEGDAGLDLVAVSKEHDEEGNIVYGTGLAIEIPRGWVGLLFPRSSNSKMDLLLSNSVGIIDSGYIGEIMMKYKKTYNLAINGELYRRETSEYNVGDRIGQLIIISYPSIEFKEVQELTESERGTGGFGSTGK